MQLARGLITGWNTHTHNQGFMEFWLNDSHYYYRNLIITVSYYPMNYVM